MKSKRTKSISAEEFDKRFDEGKSVLEYCDLSTARINLDLPTWAIDELDREAKRCGVARQALIKIWLVSRLDALRAERKKKE